MYMFTTQLAQCKAVTKKRTNTDRQNNTYTTSNDYYTVVKHGPQNDQTLVDNISGTAF